MSHSASSSSPAPAAAAPPPSQPTVTDMGTRIAKGALYGVILAVLLGFLLAKMLPIFTFSFCFVAIFAFVMIAAMKKDLEFLWGTPMAIFGFVAKILLFLISVWGLFGLAGMLTGISFTDFWAQFNESKGLLGLFDSFLDPNKSAPPEVGVGLVILAMCAWLATSVLITKKMRAMHAFLLVGLLFLVIVVDESVAKQSGKHFVEMPRPDPVRAENNKILGDINAEYHQTVEELRHKLRLNEIDLATFENQKTAAETYRDKRLKSVQPKVDPPPGGGATNPPPVQPANEISYRILPEETGFLRFQIDARVPEQELPLDVIGGDYLETWFEARVCRPVNGVPDCNGPNGSGGIPQLVPENLLVQYKVAEYPIKTAHFQAAVGYLGNESFQIGDHHIWKIPEGLTETKPRVGFNFRSSEFVIATGGGVLKVKVQK